MLCAVPLLKALRTSYPNAVITLVTSRVNDEIMRHHSCVGRVLKYQKSPLALVRFFRELRSARYDLAVVPATVSVSTTSDLIALLSRAAVRIGPGRLNGLANPSAYCFTLPVDLDWRAEPRRHQTLRNLDILRPLGIPAEDQSATIGLTAEERSEAKTFIDPFSRGYDFLIGIHPGAGKPENRWAPEKFAALAEGLHRTRRAGIIVTSGPMDAGPVSAMLRSMRCPFLLVEGKPVREVAAIIDRLDLFITNDTGLMHVAAATSAGVLGLFGPTDPLQWAPVGSKNRFLLARGNRMENLSGEEVLGFAEIIIDEIGKKS